jgi:hypothetical protein
LAKQVNKTVRNIEVKNVQKSIFENDYIILGILLVFWVIFFRELLAGNAYLFDDFIEQYYPGKFMSATMLKNGIFPFWNPYAFSGMPFFADLQVAVLYPFNLILTLFVSGGKLSALAIQNSIIFHYLLCSVFSYFLAKHFKVSGLFSLIFALMFTYSSYMIVHMIHMPLVEAVVWFPLFMLLWLKFIETKKFYFPVISGFIMALCILAGYPQVPFFVFFFAAIYTAFLFYDLVKEKKYKELGQISLGFVIILFFAFGLTAFQLLPTLEFISLSNRATFDYNFAKQGSFHPYEIITILIPKFFGVWTGNEKITDLQYWSKHSEGPWMFSISNAFISSLAVLLFVPAVRYFLKEKRNLRFTYFSFFIIGFSFLFAFGGYFFFHKMLFDYAPFFNRFRNPAHVLFLVMFTVSLISILGTDSIIREGKLKEYFSNRYFIGLLLFVLLVLFVIISGTLIPDYAKKTDQVISWVRNQYIQFLIFFLIFTALFYLLSGNKISYNVFGYLLAGVLLAEIYFLWFDQNNGTKNPEQFFGKQTQLAGKFKDEMKNEHFRVNMRDGNYMLFQRNQGLVDDIEFIEGYGALILKNYIPPNRIDTASTQTHDLMNIKYKVFNDPSGKKALGQCDTYLPRVMMFYDAVKFNTAEEVNAYMGGKEYNYRRTLAIEDNDNIKLPKLGTSDSIPQNTAKITEYGLNGMKVDVETPKDGLLFFSEVYYPAFKAYVDGKPVKILKTDFCLRSVPVEKGKHSVEMRYESDTFRTGLTLTLISSGLFILLLPVTIFFGKKGKKTDEHTD